MTTTTTVSEPVDPDRQICENLATLMFRAGIKQNQLAAAVGMTSATFSRRMTGQQGWGLAEVWALADYLSVDVNELCTELPSYDEWSMRRKVADAAKRARNARALAEFDARNGESPVLVDGASGSYGIRDSNPEPAD